MTRAFKYAISFATGAALSAASIWMYLKWHPHPSDAEVIARFDLGEQAMRIQDLRYILKNSSGPQQQDAQMLQKMLIGDQLVLWGREIDAVVTPSGEVPYRYAGMVKGMADAIRELKKMGYQQPEIWASVYRGERKPFWESGFNPTKYLNSLLSGEKTWRVAPEPAKKPGEEDLNTFTMSDEPKPGNPKQK